MSFFTSIYTFFFLGFSKETLSMISALTGVHFTLLLAKFAGVLIEIAISNSLVLYFREEPYTEIMHLRGQLRSVQENARNLRSFLRVVRQVQKSSY